MSRHSTSLLAALLLAAPALADVHVVAPTKQSASGLGPLQDAIDAAEDGDVIFLSHCNFFPCFTEGEPVFFEYSTTRAGEYEGIPVPNTTIIDGKSLTLVGQRGVDGDRPLLTGPLLILNVDGYVEIRDVAFSGTSSMPAVDGKANNDMHNVRIVDSTGRVAIERCSLLSGFGNTIANEYPLVSRGAIEIVGGSIDFVLSRSLIQAASANGNIGITPNIPFPKAGLFVDSGAHRLALYEVSLLGGNGNDTPLGFDGGDGIHIRGESHLTLHGSDILAGAAYQVGASGDSPGGAALRLEAGATAEVLDTTLTGGVGGLLGSGPPGADVSAPDGAVVRYDEAAINYRFVSSVGGYHEEGEPLRVAAADNSENPPASEPIWVLFSTSAGFADPLGRALGVLHLAEVDRRLVRFGLMEEGKFKGVWPTEGLGLTTSLVLHTQAVTLGAVHGTALYSSPSMILLGPPGMAP